MERIDERVAALLGETSAEMGERVVPTLAPAGAPDDAPSIYDERPGTSNPSAEMLSFTPSPDEDTTSIITRLDRYNEPGADALRLDLAGALAHAMRESREFRFAEEDYLLAALRLLIERHRWGPRFFNEMSADFFATGDDGLYDASVDLVNDFSVTHRLPYGGEVAARALARATEDLHRRVAGENVQDTEIILSADIPLLRGAGFTAREPLIQSERNLIYAARRFARFRREFLVSIATDYLDLVVARKQAINAARGVESFQQLEVQQEALNEAGRSTPFDMAEAKNETLEAVDRLNSSWERYRLSVDRFKSRIGVPVDRFLVIVDDELSLPLPLTALDDAVAAAMAYRLDLQTRRDTLGDAERSLAVARNALLGDLDLTASVSIPTDDERARSGLRFDGEDSDFFAGIAYSLPLDREIERLGVREAEIDLARAERDYARFRDDIAIDVRAAVRGIDAARFSLEIQERNVEIAEQRERSIAADPGRADIRQKTDAINQTSRARDARDFARRDLEVAILEYFLATGQLRVDETGHLQPLAGMPARGAVEQPIGQPTAPPREQPRAQPVQQP